jgi:4-diphosphocytidyl-2-C-methyl-D-erythritol kinase
VIVSVNCFAKINLFLKVYGKRPDGYHDIVSVMQSIDLADRLVLEDTGGEGIEITCSNADVPVDERNLVWRAAEILAEEVGRRAGGLRVADTKNIPLRGGLAGGSADGAGALAGLCRLWGLEFDDSVLLGLAARVGSDVPFCMVGGTALVRGRGEIVEPMPRGIVESSRGSGAFLLVLPPVGVDTKTAYDTLDESRLKEARKWEDLMAEYVEARDNWIRAIADASFPVLFHNDFETSLFASSPELVAVNTNLRNHAGHAILSGSGPSMFAWFAEVSEAIATRDRYVPIAGETALVAYPVPNGVQVMG